MRNSRTKWVIGSALAAAVTGPVVFVIYIAITYSDVKPADAPAHALRPWLLGIGITLTILGFGTIIGAHLLPVPARYMQHAKPWLVIGVICITLSILSFCLSGGRIERGDRRTTWEEFFCFAGVIFGGTGVVLLGKGCYATQGEYFSTHRYKCRHCWTEVMPPLPGEIEQCPHCGSPIKLR